VKSSYFKIVILFRLI